MKWKYYIPAEWNPDERHTWEDVWLLPDDENYRGESVWLTIDSLTSATEFVDENDRHSQLQPGEFSIDGVDMIVGVNDFSKNEFLHWVEVWLRESGFVDSELLEAAYEDFKDSNAEARAISQALEESRMKDL